MTPLSGVLIFSGRGDESGRSSYNAITNVEKFPELLRVGGHSEVRVLHGRLIKQVLVDLGKRHAT